MTTQLVGGYTAYRTEIKDSEKAIFEKAMAGRTGVRFEPIAVATQVVSGMNYSFFCNSQVVAPDAPVKGARVTIYEGIGKAPVVTSITNFE